MYIAELHFITFFFIMKLDLDFSSQKNSLKFKFI